MRPASRYTQQEDGTIALRLHPYYAVVSGPFWSIGMVVLLGVTSEWRFGPWHVLVPVMAAAFVTVGFVTRGLWRVACFEDGDVLVIRNVLATHRLPWSQITALRFTWVVRGAGNSSYELFVHAKGGHQVHAYGAHCVSHQRFLNTAATVRRRAGAMGVPFTVVGRDDLSWQPPPAERS